MLEAQNARVVVLMYHDVIEKRERDSVYFDVTAKQFEKQMDDLQTAGVVPISLDQLYKHLTTGAPVPPKAVVITFDDNYQGFFDNAYPLLKERKIPVAMFVHTAFVGDTAHGRPKMSWETLKQLQKEGIVTIGSHTVTHPEDITKLTPSEVTTELEDSKRTLESQLGITIDYLAYPDGKNDAVTQDLAKRAGYKMAFSTDRGTAETSPSIYAVKRYISTKLEDALQDQTDEIEAPACFVRKVIKADPIKYELTKEEGVDMAFIIGGTPISCRSATREQVSDFIKEEGAVAGINGTFFAMAAVAGTSNEMVGPVQVHKEATWVEDPIPDRVEKIRQRPMVVWSDKEIMIFPFAGAAHDKPDRLKEAMPDYTDAFVAGAWLVHEGKALEHDNMLIFGASDMMDPRRRVFLGLDKEGRIVLGASLGSVGADKLAQCAEAYGVQEAVMLDSGFSTSLVYGDKQIASGHSTPTTPSRPVPHVILLKGTLAQDPNTITIPQPDRSSSPRRRRRRRP
ncbi:MAG: polysaccharide deacetylase family protein [Armatimonadetes bacterium]|nr:polysaccharide deacetylase family protein [Armatimonadota bacterium]